MQLKIFALIIVVNLTNIEPSGCQTIVFVESPGGLVKTWIKGPSPRILDSMDLGWSLKICISDKSPRDAGTAIQGPTL